MDLKSAHDVFVLTIGDTVSKRNMYDLVQYSKVPDSPYWQGPESSIWNTPQQGINWIGPGPRYRGVIVKTRPGAYGEDGWTDAGESSYQYSFKATKGRVNFNDSANRALIHQPDHQYPVFLFTEIAEHWRFEGAFRVTGILERYVTLALIDSPLFSAAEQFEDAMYPEGGKRYVTHLMAERSLAVVKELKRSASWVCEICSRDFEAMYGVKYIEAHHKTPLATYTSEHPVSVKDLAMLCPNCHKAVHLHMRSSNIDFEDARATIQAQWEISRLTQAQSTEE
jgi:putative restriction endonuclease